MVVSISVALLILNILNSVDINAASATCTLVRITFHVSCDSSG